MNDEQHACPHCGGSLGKNAVLIRGLYSYSLEGGVRYNGKRIGLSKSSAILIGKIMAEAGSVVTNETLAASINTQAARPIILVQVLISKSKRIFRDAGISGFSIKNEFMVGAYWDDDPV